MYDHRLQDIPEPVEATRPNRQYYLREHPIKIEFLSIGCIVTVGCKTIPFTNVDEAMKEINAYVSDPSKEQQRWRELLD